MSSTKFMLPKPEDLTEDTYSISIAPSDEYQYFNYPPLTRVRSFIKEWTKRLDRVLRPCAKYRLYTEISSKGRLHFHGTIQITDTLQFYVSTVPLLMKMSTFEIDTIQDRQIWDTYCMKQSHLFEGYDTVVIPTPVVNLKGPIHDYLESDTSDPF